VIAGPERDEEPSGEEVLRLIQIRLGTPSFEKISLGCQDNSTQPPNGRFKLDERSQVFRRHAPRNAFHRREGKQKEQNRRKQKGSEPK
jgi:hypothetical protein